MRTLVRHSLITSLVTCSLSASLAQAQIQPRIVNGSPTGQGYEWMTYLLVKIPGKVNSYGTCGATLIAKDWLLTAAHCVQYDNGIYAHPSAVEAGVGIYDRTEATADQYHKAKRIVVHPDWSGEQSSLALNDIALIQLERPLTNKTVRLATLEEYQALESTAAQSRDGFSTLPLTAMGWGRLDSNPESSKDKSDNKLGSPNELHETELFLMDDQTCGYQSNGNNITGNFICVDHPVKTNSTCNGDSGGPLLLNAAGPVQIGVTSFGINQIGQQKLKCSEFPYLGFAHVAKLRNFIEAHIPELAEQPVQPQPVASQPVQPQPVQPQPGNSSGPDASANADEKPAAAGSIGLLGAFSLLPALRRRRCA